MTSAEQRSSAFVGRLSTGVVAVVIGVVLLFKASLAAYLPWVGVLFILAGAGVIALAFLYARRRS